MAKARHPETRDVQPRVLLAFGGGLPPNTPITIKRIDLTSLGAGAYTLRPTSYPFDKQLAAGQATALQFWVPANIDDPTIVGANGPVSLRLTLQYDTPAGRTQSIIVQQVHALSGLN